MHDKVNLRVALPATRRDYEFWVPLDLTVSQAASLASRLLGRREPALWQATGEEDLVLLDRFSPRDGELLNPNETIRALRATGDLADGTRVALA
jgi:hypothetical protein